MYYIVLILVTLMILIIAAKKSFVNAVRAVIDWLVRAFGRSSSGNEDIIPVSPTGHSEVLSTQVVNPLEEGASLSSSSSIVTTEEFVSSDNSEAAINTRNPHSKRTLKNEDPRKSLKENLNDPGLADLSQRSSSAPVLTSIGKSKNKKKKNKPKQPEVAVREDVNDPSFTVVKDKRAKKTKTEEVPEPSSSGAPYRPLSTVESEVRERREIPVVPASSIIEHYKKKSKGSIFLKESPPQTPIVNASRDIKEEKESRKVDSGITYAQVASSASQNQIVESEATEQTESSSKSSNLGSFSLPSYRKYYTSSEEDKGSDKKEDVQKSENSPQPESEKDIPSSKSSSVVFSHFSLPSYRKYYTSSEDENKGTVSSEHPEFHRIDVTENSEFSEFNEDPVQTSDSDNRSSIVPEVENQLNPSDPVAHRQKFFRACDSSSDDNKSPIIIEEQAQVHREDEPSTEHSANNDNLNCQRLADKKNIQKPESSDECLNAGVPEILISNLPVLPGESTSNSSPSKGSGELQVKNKQHLRHSESQSTNYDCASEILDQDSANFDRYSERDTSEANSLSEDSLKERNKHKTYKKKGEFSVSNPTEELLKDTSEKSTKDYSNPRDIDNSASIEENSVSLERQETLEEIEGEEILEEEKVIKEVSKFERASQILKSTGQERGEVKQIENYKTSIEDFISIEKNTTDSFANTISITEKFIINELNFENISTEGSKMPVKTFESPKGTSKFNDHCEQDSQIRVLTLNDQVFQESTLYRLEQNWIVEFRLGPTLFGRKIFLYCNFPEEQNERFEFVRGTYRLINWKQDEGCENSDDTSLYAHINCAIAGSFHYYFTCKERNEEKICGSGFFLVDPIIKYGDNQKLSLDCVQCQTVISKHLGSFSTWENKLRVSKESGYNMIHFTPVQELGESNSAYSLKDQLQLNPSFKKANHEMPTWEELKSFITKIRKEWKMASICDIVLNHTANETPWIQEHPEVTYNCQNCMYMRPSYLLDAALNHFSMEVKQGLYETKGIPAIVNTQDHLNAIRYHLSEGVLKELKIHELFTCDTNKYVSLFMDKARQNHPEKEAFANAEITLIQDPEYRRLASTIDMNLALKIYNIYRPGCFDEDARLRKCCEELKQKLDALNRAVMEKVENHLNAAVGNVVSGISYWRVQHDGPRLEEITVQNPLIFRYFTDYGKPKTLKECEDIMYSNNGKYLMAHNGWVLNGDPLVNFAGPQSDVYIRRELIAWGDSVKLRYGEKPSDCPYLWDRMRKYVEQTAEIFDGVRLDNCHSTPMEVAEYLLDCARKIRPDLYVVAELFTNSDEKDNIFVNKLGISSLIREAMNAWDSHEEGRLVHRFGGVPVGAFYQPNVRPLVPTIAHALFLDLTHDNPSPIEKRSVFDLLPSSALVNMACCGTGSNRGYDELVPHHISVVEETREYTEWSSQIVDDNPKYVTMQSGIIAVKRLLNDLHFKLGSQGFSQVYVDQMDPDVVAVTRHCPKTHQSYILVAFTAFKHPGENDHKWQRSIRPMRVEGVLDEIVLEATLSHIDFTTGDSKYAQPKKFEKDTKYINGFSEYKIHIKHNIQLVDSDVFEEIPSGNTNEIALNFKNFKPGSVVILKVSLPKAPADAVKEVRSLMAQFSRAKETALKTIIRKMNLSDLNRALYRCDQEERDEGNGFDTYNIPNFGKLVYAGFQGFMSLLSKIRANNDLGHPMCENLRQGNWMIEYIFQRLKLDEGTAELGIWFEENTRMLKALPRYMKPAYFDLVVTGVYILLIEQSHKSMLGFVNRGSVFVKALSMGSLQFAAYIKSADLPVLSPNLALPKPPFRLDANGKEFQACVSLSAGLPHFSVGYMRNWGRDTFIALRGLFILTGRYQEARYHILAYAACLRHGLIPNLLDGGRNSRFNCRDAVWWWLYCIKCYAEEVPNGIKILEDKVSRIFPEDDSQPQKPGAVDQTLEDVIQEALTKHFQGLRFRERNAGRAIDENMSDNGFNNQIGVHPETGFVFGGNVDNCGTWMDKMGSSSKAGNKGKPATPRDGSACEIIGLSKSVISWLAILYEKKKYKYEGVQRTHSNGSSTKWSFKSWNEKIQENFEKYFWVAEKASENDIRPDLINKRGIYKDCYGATQEWTDFQLRCNFPIVMVVAPELFNPQRAWIALEQAEKYLMGPLGMKTLDPSDWSYRGDYDNSNDSDDASVAQGFNYHQGPEWLWPVGYFLRAKLHFAAKNNKLPETIADIKYKLSKHFTELQTSDWRGLPELTNSSGSYCKDSSRTQAWSMSSILEVLHDLQKIESSA